MKSNTSKKDRLHTEIFDTAKTMDEKMTVEKGIIGTQYEEEVEEEERGRLSKGGGVKRRRRRRRQIHQ